MQALLDVILPVFLIIGFGYVAVWRKWFTEGWIDGVMRFAQNYAIPCMLFRAISQLDLAKDVGPLMLTSFYAGALGGFFVGMLGARYLFKRPWQDSVAIGFVGLFSNSVLLGLPITERAWGPDALAANFSIIAFHAAFCYGVGITAMELVLNAGSGVRVALVRISTSMARNPLVLAVLLGLLFNVVGIPVPTVVGDAADMMTRAALPAALFGLGGTLYFYRPEGDMRIIMFIVAVSLVLHPAITWSLGTVLKVPTEGFRSAVITAAMAPGVNAYMFAAHYGVAKRVAASAVLIATALTLVSAWFWLSILQ